MHGMSQQSFHTWYLKKHFLVKLEVYGQKVDMAASCHHFVRQEELYQCPCSLQNPKCQ